MSRLRDAASVPFEYETAEVREGRARLLVPAGYGRKGPGARGPLPFYNATMTVNRDMSALALARWPRRVGFALDGLAGTGAWGIRMRLEANAGDVVFSDLSERGCALIRENLARNGLTGQVLHARFMAFVTSPAFDFIDIDPFGTPVPFLDDALAGARAPSGLGVTATDTATLAGTYPDACLRRYGARSLRCPQGREVGLRILIAYCARVASRRGKAVRPLVAFAAEHFLRLLLLVESTPPTGDLPIGYLRRLEGSFHHVDRSEDDAAGPLWLGPIADPSFVRHLPTSEWTSASAGRLLDLLRQEADMPPLYVTLDDLAARFRRSPPKVARLIEALRAQGHRATRTHFDPRGVKTDAADEEIARVFRYVAPP